MEEKKAEAQVASFTQEPKRKGQGQTVLSSISHFPSRAWAGLREGRKEGLKLAQGPLSQCSEDIPGYDM